MGAGNGTLRAPAARLAYCRGLRRMDIKELAAKAGLKAKQIARLESGADIITPAAARKLAAALGMAPSMILGA